MDDPNWGDFVVANLDEDSVAAVDPNRHVLDSGVPVDS